MMVEQAASGFEDALACPDFVFGGIGHGDGAIQNMFLNIF
jgi:hypothetical protein